MISQEYLTPIDLAESGLAFLHDADDCLGKHIIYSPEKTGELQAGKIQMAIIGVNETRGSSEYYSNPNGSEKFRKEFYSLQKHQNKVMIADLGDFKTGLTKEDTYFGLASVIEELVNQQVIPVIIGGSQDLTFAHYLAYKNKKQVINMAAVDSRFDLGKPNDELTSRSYLGKIILEKPNYLFNFSCLGYQTYYVGQQAVDLMSKLYFDTYRVGQLKTDITDIEPVIRNADILSFDLSAIKQGDSPAASFNSPNGFTGEEACQIMMYAGMSDKLAGLGLYEYDPKKDGNCQTAALMAQMVWYFIEGYGNRKKDLPALGKKSFTTFRVTVSGNDRELIFIKSKKSDRWWMEFPMPENKSFLSKQLYIPCSYKDYLLACNDEIPERWWQVFQKIS